MSTHNIAYGIVDIHAVSEVPLRCQALDETRSVDRLWKCQVQFPQLGATIAERGERQ
ncbi:uncharacterized protein TRIVIDRAFT_212892 [Trichoderma virens Gv29-8]|uniref:Uncharacterized protein n=1 Tax=Hypocrea virens (strain Gv29-8 / FGSC 10586) TaxID=413071 RepID=G9MQY2_HYPVG|nr:uncharacterized protein TRIVIDRAFT_212892 [Trichoderma virens Gv29-8]EHK22510.1 hypothetical protein TRIVIDRAFT_212892 [Trichoderma virens Gv29-8]